MTVYSTLQVSTQIFNTIASASGHTSIQETLIELAIKYFLNGVVSITSHGFVTLFTEAYFLILLGNQVVSAFTYYYTKKRQILNLIQIPVEHAAQ